MRFRFSRAWALLTATLIIGCSPEPAWPDTSILRASIPADYPPVWRLHGEETDELSDEFFDLHDAFFYDDSASSWLSEDYDADYEFDVLPGKSVKDLSPQVHKAIENVISWHQRQLNSEADPIAAGFSAYSGMASFWRPKELSLLFEVCSEEKELMAAFVHSAQIAWNDSTTILGEMECKSTWYWLHTEPSLSQEEKRDLVLRFPLRRDAGYTRFRADLLQWVGFWEGLTRAQQREFGETPPYRNKLDCLDEAFLLVGIANQDLPLKESDRQSVRNSAFWKGRFMHLEFMQGEWIPRFAMQ